MNYIIGEDYTLPSLGKVYDVEVNPDIKLRSMTTNEEMKRLSHSERQYKVMADIIDDCLVTKPGISSYDMCLGDYQFLLHKLRIVTYGPEYPVSSRCPLCYTVTEDKINLDDMEVVRYSPDIEKYLRFELPRSKNHIELRLQTPRMMDNIELDIADFKKRAPSFSGDPAILFTIKNLIKSVDGEKPDPITFEQWIMNLPMMDTNYIIQNAQELNKSIGLSTDLTITCDECGLVYKSPFRITSEFYGPSIRYGVR